MRQDPTAFAAKNKASSKEPRLVVRIVFDIATIYVTSDANMTNVPGTALLGHLQNVSAVSQEINPDEARSTIGSMSFDLVDIDSDFTDALRTQLQTELQNLRGRSVELRLGYTSDYNDTQVLFTQQVRGCVYDDGTYRVTCNDIQRETRKDILEPLVTNLRLSVDEDDTTIPVQDTTGFETVFHGPSYTDGPNITSGYVRIDDEIIRYTGLTADSFTGCTRGVFNTVPAAHEVQSGAANDRQPEVEEFIYLELPGPKLAYALLTGVISGDLATLPDHWHMGIDTGDVTLSQFQNIGVDLWDTTDDNATLVLRFAGLDKTDGKRFLEEQVYQPLGVYSPVLNDGSLGLRRMNHILADAPYVMVLDEDSFTQVGALEHDYDALLNIFSIDWNWDPIAERFTRRRKVIDQGSIDVHGEADTKLLEWEGLHGSRHTDAALLQRSDSIRDRYTGPPLRLSGSLLHSYNVLEVGDVVRVQLAHVRDYTGASGPIDRSFEVQRIAVNQISGEVTVSLFGSSQRSAVLPPGTGVALPDAWYDDLGTELSTVVTIVAGVIQPGTYNLTGNANLKNTAAVYYYLGDLELADGATLTINDNVQIRVRGFFTINGDIDGSARGNAGATDDSVFANDNAGAAGFIGNTRGWEGLDRDYEVTVSGLDLQLFNRGDAVLTSGLHSSFPFLELSVRSGALTGLPDDIRGTSGGIGGRVEDVSAATIFADGGDGGDGGAGLAVICRGASLGASASIDVSGGDSATGAQVDMSGPDQVFQAGSGAPGAPGGVLFVIDGSGPSLPDVLGGLTAAYGSIPDAGEQPNTTDGLLGHLGWLTTGTAGDPLAGFNTSIVGDISASVLRIQRIAPEQTPEEDVNVPTPANLAVVTSSTGFEHVLTNTPPPAGVITEYFGSITDLRNDAVLLGASTAGRFVTTPDPSTLTYYWARNRQIQTYFVSLFTPNTTTSTVQGAALQPPQDGTDGTLKEFVFQRAASQPSTPTGNGIPSGWFDDPPGGANPLWFSTAQQELDGTTVGVWSTPRRLDAAGGTAALNIGRRLNVLEEWYADSGQAATLDIDANFSIVLPGDAPIWSTALQAVGSTSDDFFSERMTLDTSRKHRVSVWAEQPTGDRTAYLLVTFYDDAGDLISNSSTPVSDATGWSIGSHHYWQIINSSFSTDWSLYQFEFGGDATATIPTGAVSFAIGALTTRSTPGTTETTQRFHDYFVVELADDGATGPTGSAGDDAITGLLTNEAHVVAAASDGTGYSLANAGGTLKVFDGTTDVTTSATFSVVGGSGSPSTKAQNGLTMSINTSTGVYSLSGASWTSDEETFTLRAVYGGVTIDKQYTIVKSKSGSAGSSAAIVLSNQTVNSDPGGSVNGKAEYQLTATGKAEKRESGTASAFVGLETWLKIGSPGDYEVECVVSGTDAADVTGPTGSGVWYSNSTARLWVLEDTTITGGSKTASLALRIRHAVTEEIQDTATISLTANKSA